MTDRREVSASTKKRSSNRKCRAKSSVAAFGDTREEACIPAPIIRDAIIQAAVEAGDGDMVAYLKKQAETHPSAFLTLLGKVLPMQLTGGKGEPVNLEFSVRFVAADSANGSDVIDN